MQVRTYDVLMLITLFSIVIILLIQKKENEKLHDQIFELLYALGVIASKKAEGTVVQIKKRKHNKKHDTKNNKQKT